MSQPDPKVRALARATKRSPRGFHARSSRPQSRLPFGLISHFQSYHQYSISTLTIILATKCLHHHQDVRVGGRGSLCQGHKLEVPQLGMLLPSNLWNHPKELPHLDDNPHQRLLLSSFSHPRSTDLGMGLMEREWMSALPLLLAQRTIRHLANPTFALLVSQFSQG